jgi:hypothetical protein
MGDWGLGGWVIGDWVIVIQGIRKSGIIASKISTKILSINHYLLPITHYPLTRHNSPEKKRDYCYRTNDRDLSG